MRHLWSLLAGVVAAPLTWCLVALGQNGSQDTVGGWVRDRTFDTTDLLEPAAYLVAAGVLIGLVATLRISPLGPLVGGLLLITPYAGLFVSPLDVRDWVPDSWEVLDRRLPLLVPLDNGTLLLLGVLLVMAVFSVRRWRQWPALAAEPAAAEEPTAEEPAVAGPADAEPSTVPLWSPPDPADSPAVAPTVTRMPGESPWSAPPGQGRPGQS